MLCLLTEIILTEWFRRDKYLSSAMVEGDTAESYIAQGQIEMRKMSNKGRRLFFSLN